MNNFLMALSISATCLTNLLKCLPYDVTDTIHTLSSPLPSEHNVDDLLLINEIRLLPVL